MVSLVSASDVCASNDKGVQWFQGLWRRHGEFEILPELKISYSSQCSGDLTFSGNQGFGSFNPLNFSSASNDPARFFDFNYDAAVHPEDKNTSFKWRRYTRWYNIVGHFERVNQNKNWQVFRTLPITSSQVLSLELRLYIDDSLFCMEIHEDGTIYKSYSNALSSTGTTSHVTWNLHPGTFVLSCILFENGCGNIGFGVYDKPWKVTCGCDAGHHRSNGVCEMCENGYFKEESGIADCEMCPAGWVHDPDHRACSMCKPGQYASMIPSQCINCTAGRFSNKTAAPNFHSCVECPTGWSTLNKDKSTHCVQCPQGRFTPNAKGCDECPKGRYMDEIGASIICKACPEGLFSQSPAANACEGKCSSGKYLPNDCSPTYHPDCDEKRDSAEDCLFCEPGKFSNVKGQSRCFGCPGAERGSTSCSGCPPGRYKLDSSSSSSSSSALLLNCSACPSGFYSDQVEQYQCKICPSGFHAKNMMSMEAIGCEGCPQGFFGNEEGKVQSADSCFACPAGFYWKGRPEDGVREVCGSCPQGRYNNEIGKIGLSVCEPCLPGRYGNHSESDNADACLGCEPGRFSPEIAAQSAASCKPCAKGQYQSFPKKSTCTLCPAGWASSSVAAALCLPCSPGKFSERPESLSCNECHPGRQQRLAAQSSCEKCHAGSYSLFGRMTNCTPCGPGFFSDKPESLSCTACPKGWSQGNNGSAWCSVCQPGRFRGEEGSAESCGKCLPGLFRGEDHSPTECKSCPNGWFQSEEGATSCRQCRPGQFRGDDDSPVSCQPCSQGTHAPREGADHCRSCPPGTYTGTKGEATCKECEAGRFVATNTSRTCHSCARGQFSAREGKTACDPCPLGQRSNENFVACLKPDWTTAGDCKVGKEYLNNSDEDNLRWTCVACPAGAQCVEDMIGGGRARQIHELRVLPGFWNASFPELDGLHPEVAIVACVFPEDCLGDGRCRETSMPDSPLCAVCMERHFRDSNQCVKCSPKAPLKKALPVLSVALLLIGIAFCRRRQLFEFQRRNKSSWRDFLRIATIAVSFAQINASFPALMNNFPWPIEYVAFLKQWSFIEFDLVDLLKLNCLGGRWDYRARIVLVTMVPVASVLVVGGFYCIRYRSLARGRLRLDSEDDAKDRRTKVRRAFEHLFDIVDFDCSGTIEPFELKILLQTLGEGSATLSEARDMLRHMGGVQIDVSAGNRLPSIKTLVIAKEKFVRAALSGEFPESLILPWVAYSESVRLRSSFMSIMLMTLFILHAPVSAKLCRFYACAPVAGRMFLQEDFSIECWDGDFLAFNPFVVTSMVVFSFGFPLSLICVLFFHRKNLHKPKVYARFGFLYAPFQEGCEFWEFHELTRKLMLTGLLVFFPPVARAAASIAICVVTVAALNYYRPHRNHTVFVVEQASFLLTTLKYVAAVLLVARDASMSNSGPRGAQIEREAEDRIVAAMLIALDLIFVVGTFSVMLLAIIGCRRKQLFSSDSARTHGEDKRDLSPEQLRDEPRRSLSRTRSQKLRLRQQAANDRVNAASNMTRIFGKSRPGGPARFSGLTSSVVKDVVTAARLRRQASTHFKTRLVQQDRVKLGRRKARARLAARLQNKKGGVDQSRPAPRVGVP